jgi:hypothetical protein
MSAAAADAPRRVGRGEVNSGVLVTPMDRQSAYANCRRRISCPADEELARNLNANEMLVSTTYFSAEGWYS